MEKIDVKRGSLLKRERYKLYGAPEGPAMDIEMEGTDSWGRRKRLVQTTSNFREITHAIALHRAIEELGMDAGNSAISFMVNFNHTGFSRVESEAGGNNIGRLSEVYKRIIGKAPRD